jgi:hypothetical protein
MLHAAIQVVLYGFLAGFTALGFAATLTVMPSGRLKAVGFGAGFVGAQILTCSVLVIFGIAATGSSKKSHPDLRAALEVALALVLIALALLVHRRPLTANDSPTAHQRSKARTQALLDRLSRLRVLTTVVAGFLLGIGGPKRLVLPTAAGHRLRTPDTRRAPRPRRTQRSAHLTRARSCIRNRPIGALGLRPLRSLVPLIHAKSRGAAIEGRSSVVGAPLMRRCPIRAKRFVSAGDERKVGPNRRSVGANQASSWYSGSEKKPWSPLQAKPGWAVGSKCPTLPGFSALGSESP